MHGLTYLSRLVFSTLVTRSELYALAVCHLPPCANGCSATVPSHQQDETVQPVQPVLPVHAGQTVRPYRLAERPHTHRGGGCLIDAGQGAYIPECNPRHHMPVLYVCMDVYAGRLRGTEAGRGDNGDHVSYRASKDRFYVLICPFAVCRCLQGSSLTVQTVWAVLHIRVLAFYPARTVCISVASPKRVMYMCTNPGSCVPAPASRTNEEGESKSTNPPPSTSPHLTRRLPALGPPTRGSCCINYKQHHL